MSDTRVRGLTLFLLAALGLYCVLRLDLKNSITHFIPSPDDAELIELSLELVHSQLSRRMALSVGGGPGRARGAAELADALRTHPEVAWAESGVDEGALLNLYELYFDRRVYLASDTPETEIPAMLESEALEERAIRLRNRLTQPVSILVSKTAPADPLGLFERVVERIRGTQPALATGGGNFTSADGDYAIVLLGLRSSPFDSKRQAELLREIETQFARINAAHGNGLKLEQSGVNRITVASERSVRSDINFISSVSITIVCLIFLVVFRSLRHLLIAILTPLGGFAAAMAVALTFSAPVHGITLGFGFVLIGVAIDYPIHLMNHHALSRTSTDPRESVARIRSSLLLSGLTTTLAFTALALSNFPGLRDMGTFAAIGVPVALGLTVFAVPAFLPSSTAPTPVQLFVNNAFVRLVRWLGGRPLVASAIFAGFAVVAAAGLPQLRWEDDPAALMAVDPTLLAESERVRRRVSEVDGGRFVVGLAQDRESVLALNGRIHRRLEGAIASGHMEGMLSLHSVLWSQGLQRENLAAFRAVTDLDERIERAFPKHGFRSGAFQSFTATVASPLAAPLRPEDLANSSLARALDSLADLDDRWAVVTYLRGVRSGEGIRNSIAGLEGAHYVDQKNIIVELFESYRRSTVRMVGIGSVVIFLVLQLRYRSLKRGLLAFLPSALVALTTFGLFGLLGIAVNVVSAISLVVVLGMGVDYGIFTVDGALRPERLGATLSSILISCLTTILVFGTLAFSGQPVLRAIGLTAGSGILLALVLSPAVVVLVRRDLARW